MNGIYKSRILDKKMNHVKTKKAKKETKEKVYPIPTQIPRSHWQLC